LWAAELEGRAEVPFFAAVHKFGVMTDKPVLTKFFTSEGNEFTILPDTVSEV
jgi:hypothetical protein